MLSFSSFIVFQVDAIRWFFPPLLVACMVFAMAFFPASKDYKLPLLTVVFGVYTLYLEKNLSSVSGWRGTGIQLLYLLMAFCYCSTLYSYAYRPVILQNSFPFLFIIMLGIPIIEQTLSRPKKPQRIQLSNYPLPEKFHKLIKR